MDPVLKSANASLISRLAGCLRTAGKYETVSFSSLDFASSIKGSKGTFEAKGASLRGGMGLKLRRTFNRRCRRCFCEILTDVFVEDLLETDDAPVSEELANASGQDWLGYEPVKNANAMTAPPRR